MIVQKIVKGLLSVFMLYIFVIVGTNMVRYGQQTGFESDKQMIGASLNRMTSSRDVSDEDFIYQTGIRSADEATETFELTMDDLVDQFQQLIGSFTDAMMIMIGVATGIPTGFWQASMASVRQQEFEWLMGQRLSYI